MIPSQTCHYYCISRVRRALPRCLITEEKRCPNACLHSNSNCLGNYADAVCIEEIVKARLAYALRQTVKQRLNEKCPDSRGLRKRLIVSYTHKVWLILLKMLHICLNIFTRRITTEVMSDINNSS